MMVFSEWLKCSSVHEHSQWQNTLGQRLLLSQLFWYSVTLLLPPAICHTKAQVAALHLQTCLSLSVGDSRICLAQQTEQCEQEEFSAIS